MLESLRLMQELALLQDLRSLNPDCIEYKAMFKAKRNELNKLMEEMDI